MKNIIQKAFLPNKLNILLVIFGLVIGISTYTIQSSKLKVSQDIYLLYTIHKDENNKIEPNKILERIFLNRLLREIEVKYDIKYKISEETYSIEFYCSANTGNVDSKIDNLRKAIVEFHDEELNFFNKILGHISPNSNSETLIVDKIPVIELNPVVTSYFSKIHLIKVLITPAILLYLISVIYQLSKLKLNNKI